MPRPLLIVAAGGLGRETAEAARAGTAWEPVGFLDDDPARQGLVVDGLPVLGGLDAVVHHPDAAVAVCVGKGAGRLAVAERLAAQGVGDDRLATVAHPSVHVPASCDVGAGTVLLAGVVLTASVRLGRLVVCMPNVVLTHDDEVEDGGTLCAGVLLGGTVRVGRGAYLGMGCAVRENVVVGAGAVVGMGAVVLRDVPDGATVAGVPAVPLASRARLGS